MYNPTAILAGFILKAAPKDSGLYATGLGIARELTELFLRDPAIEMHPLKCVDTLLHCITWAGLQEHFPMWSCKKPSKYRVHG